LDGLLFALRDRLKPPLWDLIDRAAKQAQERHWNLYLVGGIVRDLLIHKFDNRCPIFFTDIDLVVDGCAGLAVPNGGIELAKAMQKLYPNTRLELHPKFQTADLIWKNDPQLNSLSIDFATARTEYYPYPGANPVVQPSSIRQDLYRRDFTVNALAIQLTQPDRGELLDFFGGLEDLQNRQIRVLHSKSFIDDPTRIYRAVRYTLRLQFELETQTKSDIEEALNSDVHRQAQAEKTKVPGVQTRLKKELKYMLEAPYWQTELKQLSELGALKCLHPTLQLDDRVYRQMCSVDGWLRRFPDRLHVSRWLLLLEVLLTRLAPDDCYQVAVNLKLSEDSLDRLQKFYPFRDNEIKSLSQSQRPSEIVRLLKPIELPLLILIGVDSSREIRRKIWQYLTHWIQIKPILNGEDLKTMGYRPSPQFRKILDEIWVKTLDGDLLEKSQAKAWILQQYPNWEQDGKNW
jgi:tRNA nucleotidyltransferase (CCA-adding enzyme)